MRTAAVIVVVIFAQMFATGQKRTGSGVHKSVSSSQSMPKSVSSEAVAAALRTNSSSSANELSKIEHESVKPQSRPAAQKSVSQNAAPDLGKNKPMKFSHKPPRKP
jgi:Rod binding domain-containing protein